MRCVHTKKSKGGERKRKVRPVWSRLSSTSAGVGTIMYHVKDGSFHLERDKKESTLHSFFDQQVLYRNKVVLCLCSIGQRHSRTIGQTMTKQEKNVLGSTKAKWPSLSNEKTPHRGLVNVNGQESKRAA